MEQIVESQTGCDNTLNNFQGMPDLDFGFSLVSPPSLRDTQSSNGSAGQGAITPAHFGLSHTNPFEIQLNQDLGYIHYP
jgi:hypothetical protein